MKKNIGKTDKIIRIVLAIILVALYFTHVVTGTLGIIFLIAAGISLVTALINFCGLYVIFGLSSCPLKKDKTK